MKAKPRAFARSAAQVLAAATVGAGGVFFVATPAHAAVPTISGVVVAGTTATKVVGSGTTVVITGAGFTGMVDNSPGATGIVGGAGADADCNVSTSIPLGCSQVRFVGTGAAPNNYTKAANYTVVSDTQIYATVPDGIPVNLAAGAVDKSPALYSGKMFVQVVNTAVAAMGLSASTSSDVYYRHKLRGTIATAPQASPLGGGTVIATVEAEVSAAWVGYTLFSTAVTAPIAAPLNNFTAEKITAYFVAGETGASSIYSTSVTRASDTTVNVLVPQGTPADSTVGIMLIHDGIVGSPDATAVTYPAVITSLSNCGTTAPTNFATVNVTCTGPASAPTTGGPYYVKVTGKGLTGATLWDFGTDTTTTCVIISDAVANCTLTLDDTPEPVVAVSFTAGNPPGPADPPQVGTTAGSIFVFTDLV